MQTRKLTVAYVAVWRGCSGRLLGFRSELRLKFKLPNQSGAGEIADPGIIYADAKAHGGLCCSLARLFWPTLGLALAHGISGRLWFGRPDAPGGRLRRCDQAGLVHGVQRSVE